MAKTCVTVLFGGTSSLRNYSLASAENVIKNIPKDKYEVVCIGITKKGRWLYYPNGADGIGSGEWEFNPDCTSAIISPDPMHGGVLKLENDDVSIKRTDVVFPILHGRNGEDGSVQGLLTLSDIPYVGSDVIASAVCRDKISLYSQLRARGFEVADWEVFLQSDLDRLDERCREISDRLGNSLCVKSSCGGESINTKRVENIDELKEAVKLAFTHDDRVVVKKFIYGREFQVALFEGNDIIVSPVGEIETDSDNCRSQHILNTGNLHIPAQITDDESLKIRNTACEVYKSLGCSGMAMIDIFYTAEKNIIINKISTIPGLMPDSPFPKLIEKAGIAFPEMLEMLIEKAIEKGNTEE